MPDHDFAWYHQRGLASTHVLRLDRERWLRQVAALRKVVELHQSCDDVSYGDDSTCPELRAVASIWSEHPAHDTLRNGAS